MTTADDVRSILKDAGVPMTRKQIFDALPEDASIGAADVFLTDGRHRGELTVIVEDGKAHYALADGYVAAPKATKAKPAAEHAPAPPMKTKSAPRHDSGGASAPKPRNGKSHASAPGEREQVITADNVLPPASIAPAPHASSARNVTHLADAVGYAEAALQAYIESVVDKTLYGFLLNARDAARRALEQAHA
jgi:hypothetical protein